jgi:hypothetical protein
MAGRPPATLAPVRRRQLERAAVRVAAAQAKLDEARRGLAEYARYALEEGASYRVVAEALGMSASALHELVGR